MFLFLFYVLSKGSQLSIPAMRANSVFRSRSSRRMHCVNVLPSLTCFVTRKWRNALEASCGQCVIKSIWRRWGKSFEPFRNLVEGEPADTGIHFVKNERGFFIVLLHGNDREHESGQFAA